MKWYNALGVCFCVCVNCDGACKHTFACMWYEEFTTGTFILAEKQNEHHNPFQKWPRHGAADNCIICWFNCKYKTLCKHHCRRLWYTSWQLIHRGTSQTCRGIWASFKHQSTFRNLIGLHLSSWSNQWLRLPSKTLRTSYSAEFFFFSPLWSFSAFDRACCSYSIGVFYSL